MAERTNWTGLTELTGRPNFCHCSFVYSTLSDNREARVRWGVADLCAIHAYLHTPESRPIERILHPHALRTQLRGRRARAHARTGCAARQPCARSPPVCRAWCTRARGGCRGRGRNARRARGPGGSVPSVRQAALSGRRAPMLGGGGGVSGCGGDMGGGANVTRRAR